MEKQDSYSHVLKYTGIFGGVQGLNILVGLVRNKLVALILGPGGMGLASLFSSALKMVGDSTNLGLPVSAVKDLSAVYEKGDFRRVAEIVMVVRSWCLLTAFAGMLLCMAASPLLSRWTFGDSVHTLQFVLLGPAVAFTAISGGEAAILKATRQLRKLAMTSIFSVFSALLISVPLYYFLGILGVVPVLVAVALAQAAVTMAYSFRLYPFRLSFRPALLGRGLSTVRLGASFVVAGFFASVGEFLIRSYLNHSCQMETVGLYNSGYYMTVVYAGLVFSAMETDYFPRLSAISQTGRKFNEVVNRQIEISFLVLSPMLVAFIICAPVLLPLLYSGKFMPVLGMVQVAALSMYMRVVYLPIEYIPLSRGDSFVFMTMELIAVSLLVGFVVAGHSLFGLVGTGYGITASSLLEVCIVAFYYGRRYHYALSRNLLKYIAVQIPIGILAYCVTFIDNLMAYCLAGGALFCVSLWLSFAVVKRESDLFDKIKSKFLKR